MSRGPIRSPVWSDPTRQPPQGAVEIDWSHSLAQGLAFCAIGGFWFDLTQHGQMAVRPNYTAVLPSPRGVVFDCSTTAAVSAGFEFPFRLDGLITRDFSVVVEFRPRLFAVGDGAPRDSCAIIEVPYRAADWFAPWVSVFFGRQFNTNGRGALGYASAGTYVEAATASDAYFVSREWRRYAAVRFGASAAFYRDGVLFESVAFTTNTNIDWGERRPIELLVNGNGRGNATDGQLTHVYVWRRPLARQEVEWLYAEPYGFLRPIVRRRWFVPTTGAEFAAAISGTATVAGALSTAITLGAAASGVATTAGALTTAITLGASLSAVGTAAADLTNAITLATAVSAAATATAGLATAITLTAQAPAVATVAADLTVAGILLAAAVDATATTAGVLTTAITLSAAASTSASASGGLATAIHAVAAITASAATVGALTTVIAAAAAVSATATTVGTLATAIVLGGAAPFSAAVAADLLAGRIPVVITVGRESFGLPGAGAAKLRAPIAARSAIRSPTPAAANLGGPAAARDTLAAPGAAREDLEGA